MHIIHLAYSFHPCLMSAITIDVDGSLFFQLGLFLVLFLAMKPLIIDPFLKVIEERENRTDGARRQAREMDIEAGDLGQDYEQQLGKVRKVAAEERERLRAEAQKLEAEIFKKAQSEANRIVEDGKSALEKQAGEVRAQLTEQSAALSQQIVSKMLGREVSS